MDLDFRVWGFGCRVSGSGFGVQDSGFRSRVQGAGFGLTVLTYIGSRTSIICIYMES